jgi:hypothetical protein
MKHRYRVLFASTCTTLSIQTTLFSHHSDAFHFHHESCIWQVLDANRSSCRRRSPSLKHFVPIFVHSRIVSFHLGQVHHRIDQVGYASSAAGCPLDDAVDGFEDGRGLFADVWHFAIVGAGDSAVRRDTRDARDVDCTTAGWNRSGLGKAGWTVWVQEKGFPIGMLHCVLGGLVFCLFESRNDGGVYETSAHISSPDTDCSTNVVLETITSTQTVSHGVDNEPRLTISGCPTGESPNNRTLIGMLSDAVTVSDKQKILSLLAHLESFYDQISVGEQQFVHHRLSDIPLPICPRLAQGITARLYQARRYQHLLTLIGIIDPCTDYRSLAQLAQHHKDAASPICVHRYPAREQCLHRRGHHHQRSLFHLFGEYA